MLTTNQSQSFHPRNDMALSGGPCPSAEAAAYLVNHVVLPPQLPQADDFDAAHERFLLRTTIDALRALKTFVATEHDSALTNAIMSIENIQKSQDGFGNISETELCKLLNELAHHRNNSPIPLKITAQNAGIIISLNEKDIIFESFELSPTNENAMLKGRLTRSFPGQAASIPATKMQDQGLQRMLAQTLAKMSSQAAPGFQPVARKGGQLHDEYRDTTHPGMVTDYLLNVVASLGKVVSVHRISKNTREEVLWNRCKQPWRRSSLWLLVRVTLQLHFTRQGCTSLPTDAQYKVFMVQLLSLILSYAQSHWQTSGSGHLYATNAKLLRRLRKLENLSQLNHVTTSWIDSIQKCMTDAYAYMDKQWQAQVHDTGSNLDTTGLRSLQPKESLDIHLPDLDAFLAGILARQTKANFIQFNPKYPFPVFSSQVVPQAITATGDDRYSRLAAMESWVENHLRTWADSHDMDEGVCRLLGDLIKTYHQSAVTAYQGVPSSTSMMYLVILEIWVACDKSACSLFPLLKRYDPEVPLIEFQCLTLPLRSQMQRLQAVEIYVRSRERSAMNKTSLYCDFGKESSFAVEFFKQNTELQQLLRKIEQDASAKRSEKCQQLAQLKLQYKKLMDQYNSAKCEYVEIVTNRYHGYTKTVHSRYCGRCSLRKRADGLEINIFEWPLSPIPSVAKATVFELKIPQSYSAWRDTSVFVIRNVLGCKSQTTSRPENSYTLNHHQDLSRILSQGYSQQRIVPLSSIKPHAVTHRKNKKAIPHLQDSDVCLQSALRYQYYDIEVNAFTAKQIPQGALPRSCMYQMPARSKALELFLQKHPSAPDGVQPNEVIASLADCPAHMSIEEFKAFGTLPLGRNIIYSNILTQLAIPIVDFSKVETQCLVSQIVTQVGLPSDDVERINHSILTDPIFGCKMISHLEVAAQRVEENSESWRAMSIFVQLTCRIANLTRSQEVRQRCLRFLNTSRRISTTWLHRLKARAAQSTNDEQRTELFGRVTKIALLGVTTFDIETEYIDIAIQEKDAVSSLLQFSIAIQENHELISGTECLQQSEMQAWRTIMYRVFQPLRKEILRDCNGLNKAVLGFWAAFQPEMGAAWSVLDSTHQHWLYIASGKLPVHVNLLSGELLVNGLPLTRLPAEFLKHQLYRPLFSSSALEVAPTNEPGMLFSAKELYHGHELHFGMEGADLLIFAKFDQRQ